MKKILLISMIILLPSCSFWNTNSKTEMESNPSPLVNLVDSTHIIRKLIEKNKIGDLLEDHDPEQLTLLLDNTSPAQMAFESEVLSATAPIVVTYYFHENKGSEDFIKQLEDLAIKYDDEMKFVLVNAEQLFSLAQDAQIEELPTVLLVKDREIIDRFEGNLSKRHFEEKLKTYIK
ncbi:thioredoxin family protein [Candidatus Dependentiae bacterium]